MDRDAMKGCSLEFRETRPGEYWPPILPNGRFFGVPDHGTAVVEILRITDIGLECGGISYEWEDLLGISIEGNTVCLTSEKYRSGGVRFIESTCSFIDEQNQAHVKRSGYPVEYCLMNRVTFELQRRGG